MSTGDPPAPAPSESGDTSADEVRPPRLLQYHQAELPPGVSVSEPTRVPLELVIDETGRVSDARPLDQSAGAELVSAAIDAALKFSFEPARVNGKAVSVVVQYEYWFSPAPATAPSPAEGKSDAPPDDTTEAEAARPAAATPKPEPVPQGDATEMAPDEEVYEAVARVEAPVTEPTRRSMPKERLVKMPGARGDALRAIEVLPGVSRSPQGSNPILRGASGHESAAYLNGTRIPELYHFGGLTSVVNPALLEAVELYPGNFSSRYGNATGGVIEAKLRAPKTDGLHGAIDLNLVDSSVLVEGPVTSDFALAAAVRRSNIDFVFDTLVPDDAFDVVAAPVYWDFQVIGHYRPSARSELSVTGVGSKDSLKLVFDEPNQDDPAVRGELSGSIEFQQLTIAYSQKGSRLDQHYQVTLGREVGVQQLGDWSARFDRLNVAGRADWDVELTQSTHLVSGLDLSGFRMTGSYRGPVAPSQEGSLDQPGASLGLLDIDEVTRNQYSPAVYTELRSFVTDAWLVVPGVRLDYFADLQALTVNPRLNQRYTLTENTTLKTGVGLYSQRPVWHESFEQVGNPDLNPYHALHTSLGVEQHFGDAVKLDADAFYKYLYNRVVSTVGNAPPHFINDGKGRIYGIEFGAQLQPNSDWLGQLSYTLSRSERQDRSDPWRLFDYDQSHVLNAASSYELGAGWQVGARFRYITGNPVTPVLGSVYDATNDAYIPRYGGHNSERDPAFHQLDLRVEKRFSIGSGALTPYLEVLNVYNAENAEGYSYSYDYSMRERVSGMPFFPNLGLRGEL